MNGICEIDGCDQPGRLVEDPYALEIEGETVPVILCEKHLEELHDEI